MASATPPWDIDEQSLQCCLCKDHLKEPKILPCLHKYCQQCLKKSAKKRAKEIQCVTCRKVHTLPKGGIDSLKTDFNTKNIIEFIQLQDSVKVDPLRTCIHCEKKLEASAFCFRCNDFLCKTCHKFHASNSIVKDHHPHIFSLNEAEAANLTIQELSSLKEAPRCQAHPEKLSGLCCTTCHNLPICIPCSYGKHKDHNLKEVTSLAEIQREMLRGKVANLMQYKEKAYQMPEEIRKILERFETVMTTADCIRDAQNDWADVQSIPDVCRAIDLLSNDVKKGSQGLGILSAVQFGSLSPAVTVRCKAGISKDVESVIDTHKILRRSAINDITGNKDGSIALSGYASDNETHLTVINMKGHMLQQEFIRTSEPFWSPKCSFQTQSKIAMIPHEHGTLGIYDMRDQSIEYAMMKDIPNWPLLPDYSVTTDPANGNITVGCYSKNVYIFNNQLKHVKTITLPDGIQRAWDIAMHKGSLLLCDSSCRKAIAVTIHGTASQVKYQFPEPTIDEGDWWPSSLCTDRSGHVYILWRGSCSDVIVQYSGDGGEIEMMREVDESNDIWSMTSVQTKYGEKLLLLDSRKCQILVYGLV